MAGSGSGWQWHQSHWQWCVTEMAAAAAAPDGPASQRAAEELLLPPAVHSVADDLRGAQQLELSPEEIAQFMAQGWLVKRGLVPAAELAPFVDQAWASAVRTAPALARDDPASWIDPAEHWTSTQASDGTRVALELSASSEFRDHDIGADPAFLAATSAHPHVLHVVEALAGGPLRRPNRNRGVYFIFPRSIPDGRPATAQLNPHLDATPAVVQAAIYLGDVGARAGGFTLWPGSAQILYGFMEQERNYTPTGGFGKAFRHIKETITPLEFSGQAGDAIFYHGLSVHSTGINTSRAVRLSSIHDFQRLQPAANILWSAKVAGPANLQPDGTVPRFYQDGRPVPAELREAAASGGAIVAASPWFVDCLEYGPEHAAPPDMWASWNLGRHPVRGDAVRSESWWSARGITEFSDRPFAEARRLGAPPRSKL